MVVHAYYPFGETRVQRQAEALAERGYEVDVICLRGPGEARRERVNGVDVIRVPTKRFSRSAALQLLEYLAFFLLAAWELNLRSARRNYAVVQVHNLPDFLVFSAIVPRLRGSAILLDIHDLMPEFFASRFASGADSLGVRILRWQEQLSCRFADHVVTVTEAWRKTLIRRGVSESKSSVVMNLADDRIFRPSNPSRAPSADGDFQLLYHGTLTDRYGIDLLVRAVHLLKDEIPELRLTIHGWGDALASLRALAAQLQIDDRIEFDQERLDVPDLARMIEEADLGVVPNRADPFTDGILPTKLLEYTAMGTPAVAARTSAIQEYFDDGMVALFDPGDAADLAQRIRELHADRPRLAALSENAARFNERYCWQRQSAEYAQLVERLGRGKP